MPSQSTSILLVGCGHMGGAMLSGWLSAGIEPERIVVQDPQPPEKFADLISSYGVRHVDELQPSTFVDAAPAVAVMAVKPQIMEAVFARVGPQLTAQTLILSIAAGRTIASFARAAVPDAAIVRSIPNTPSAIGRGMTVCCGNEATQDSHRQLCEDLLSVLGDVAWVNDESLIDAATAVSGSGPAYVFLLAECLADAARAVGFDATLARRLAETTVSGAGELLRRSGTDAATLRQNVTSPNGTTEAALKVLMESSPSMRDLLTRAVEAANRRSRELSG